MDLQLHLNPYRSLLVQKSITDWRLLTLNPGELPKLKICSKQLKGDEVLRKAYLLVLFAINVDPVHLNNAISHSKSGRISRCTGVNLADVMTCLLFVGHEVKSVAFVNIPLGDVTETRSRSRTDVLYRIIWFIYALGNWPWHWVIPVPSGRCVVYYLVVNWNRSPSSLRVVCWASCSLEVF